MNIEYKPHLLEWTDEKVARFWSFYNNYPHYDGSWFTEMAGAALLNLVNKHVKLKGKILDYGTGKGFLLQHLLQKNELSELYACDFTDSLAAETDRKFRNHQAFKGCKHITKLPSEYENNFFDFVFLVETIEHLTDNYLYGTLQEIHRILKPGGIIIITTPNSEVLEKTHVHCADCGAIFHHMQHVRCWTPNSLLVQCAESSFNAVFCKAVNLSFYADKNPLHYAVDILKRIRGNTNKPNLIYLGKK